jgi:hypothetical protein
MSDSKTIGTMLAQSLFKRNGGASSIQDDDLVPSLPYLSPWDLYDFATSVFQEVYQSTDLEELTRFQNIIETPVINGADLTVIKPPWRPVRDLDGALVRYIEVLLTKKPERGLSELKVARQSYIAEDFFFKT